VRTTLNPGLASIGAQDPQAAAIGHDPNPRSGGRRLGREQPGHVQELAERVGADHARLREQRVDRCVRRGQQSSGVRTACPRTPGRAPSLHDDDRLARRDATRHAGETPRIAERLEVEQDDVRSLVAVPKGQEVGAREVRFVTDGDERRQPETPLLRCADDGDSERSALRHEGDATRRRLDRAEARVQADSRVGVHHAQAVGSHEPHASGTADAHQLPLALATAGAGLGEAGRYDDERTDALGRAVACHVEDGVRRDRDDREIQVARHVSHRAV